MSLFRRDPDSHLEHELRQARPKPREELSRGIASRIERQIPARMGLRLRVGVALASTVVLAVFAASVGGVGYAASSASHAVKAVTQVVTQSHASAPKPAREDSNGPSHDNGKSGPQGHDNNNNNDNNGRRGDDDKGKGNGNGNGGPGDHEYHKVHMCHGHHPGDDIEVALPAVPAHLAHGDTLGRCRDRK